MKSYLFGGGFLLALLVIATIFWTQSEQHSVTIPVISSDAPITPPKTRPVAGDFDSGKPPIHKFKYHYPPSAEEDRMVKWLAGEIAKDPAFEWKSSINFYGLVVDENDRPIQGAQVKWISTNVTGNGHGFTSSSADGRFFIGTAGKVMSVLVQKEGYRTVERNANFEFADFTRDNYYDHDQANPVIFHLRKIPPFESIYIISGIIRENLIGNRIYINPRQKNTFYSNGQVEGIWVETKSGNNSVTGSEVYSLTFGTSGQGVVQITGDTDLIAPFSGYINPLDPPVIVAFDHQRYVKASFFFKDGSGHYGKADFDIELAGHVLTVGYDIRYNPSGGVSLSAPQQSAFQINKR